MFVLRSEPPDPDSEAAPRNGAQIIAIEPASDHSARQSPDASETGQIRGWLAETVADRTKDNAGTTDGRANPPLNTSMLPLFASAFAVRFGGAAAHLQCPKHIADTQALIDRVYARMVRDAERIPDDIAQLIYALLDDARMLLGAARRNHEQPQGPFDHARAYAKADAALGHARAAEILQSRCSQARR
jgi:hypothetical protein